MAEDRMSIVPYGSNLDIVLRHNDSIVCLDRDSQELVLRNAAGQNNGIDHHLELTDCPYCHRPIREDHTAQDNRRGSTGAQAEFVNPNYFRMLHNSLPSPVNSSGSSPHRRRLYQPALPDVPTSDSNYQAGSGRTSSPPSQGISSGAFTQGYFKKFFAEESVLGRGGKGVVLLVRHVLDGVSLGFYACKRVPVGDDHEWLEKVLGEVQLLQHLSHQNLVSYRHVWLEDAKMSTFGPSVPCAFILQQYCNAGDLHNYICGSVQTSTTAQQLKERLRNKSKGKADPGLAGPRMLQFDEIYSFFKDITSGLRYLHANGYIHRDLKPNNCLLSQDGDGIRVLVSDFGEVQSQDAMRRSTGTTGTISYCAPEVLRREYPDELPYVNADIINEELEDLDQLREEIGQWTGFDNRRRLRPDLPEKLYIFLERLLSVDPNRRPSADEVLNGIQAGANANSASHDSLRYRRTSPGSYSTTTATSTAGDSHSSFRIQPVDNQDPAAAELPLSRPRSPRKSASSRPIALHPTSPFKSSPAPIVEDADPQKPPLSPERNLIIRPRYNSNNGSNTTTPTVSPTRRAHHDHGHGDDGVESPPGTPTPLQRHQQQQPRRHLLPPPPERFSLMHLLNNPGFFPYYCRWHTPLPLLQLCFFLLKTVSAFQPCMPLAVNPWAFYPLLILATMTLRSRSMVIQVATTIVHLLVVGASFQLGGLCVAGYDYHTHARHSHHENDYYIFGG